MTKHINDIEYELIDPTGNITALVRTAVDVPRQPSVASLIMSADNTCEQVGFISNTDDADITLRMAAGEFCGNATLSAAALYCHDNGLEAGCSRTVTVRSSGCKEVLSVNITRKDDSGFSCSYSGRIRMPGPQKISGHVFTYNGAKYELPVVEFDGISHVTVKRGMIDISDGELGNVIPKWCEELDVAGLGIMLTDLPEDLMTCDMAGKGMFSIVMRPLVYVPAISSCFWENSCASGTTAVAAYLGHEMGSDISLLARQPGGVLTVHVSGGDPVLEGNIRI